MVQACTVDCGPQERNYWTHGGPCRGCPLDPSQKPGPSVPIYWAGPHLCRKSGCCSWGIRSLCLKKRMMKLLRECAGVLGWRNGGITWDPNKNDKMCKFCRWLTPHMLNGFCKDYECLWWTWHYMVKKLAVGIKRGIGWICPHILSYTHPWWPKCYSCRLHHLFCFAHSC